MRIKITLLFVVALLVGACAKVPITGRKQLKLLPSTQMHAMSYEQYKEVIAKGPLSKDQRKVAQIKRVGDKIKNAVVQYLKDNGQSKRIKGFEWEFNLIQEDVLNAWCMPGGKVAFYTGILPVCKDETGIAVVMGHEVAHAIAKHGNERMSTQIVAQMGVSSLSKAISQNPQKTAQIFNSAVGVSVILPFSRKHEAEADHMGLIFMAMAGYDPREAPKLWERMDALGGEAPPEILSTHPSNKSRIKALNSHMEEALTYYKK